MIEAVVFDLDGVLIDNEHVWDEVRQQLAEERGGRWNENASRHDGYELPGMVAPRIPTGTLTPIEWAALHAVVRPGGLSILVVRCSFSS